MEAAAPGRSSPLGVAPHRRRAGRRRRGRRPRPRAPGGGRGRRHARHPRRRSGQDPRPDRDTVVAEIWSSPSPRWEPTTPRCARSTCHDAKSHVAPAPRRLRCPATLLPAGTLPAHRRASSPRCSAPPGAIPSVPPRPPGLRGAAQHPRRRRAHRPPRVLALLDRLLLPNFLLSQLGVVEVGAGAPPPPSAPRRPALSAVPPRPGPVGRGPVDDRPGSALTVWPGSHRWPAAACPPAPATP